MKHICSLVLLISLLPGCALAQEKPAVLMSYADCVKAGNPITRSQPASCRTPDGLIFFAEPELPGKQPAALCINSCGNGICEELVCMARGCPCAESPGICPADCPVEKSLP